jgi:hypothetical protein
MQPFVSKPIGLTSADIGASYNRADLIFDGVDHSGASFALRVFFNNPAATAETGRSAENGYVGSVYVFGHGGCFGDEGHCDVPTERRPFDARPPHQLTPARMWIQVTGALRQLAQHEDRLTITVVHMAPAQAEADKPMPFEKISLVTYA